MSERSTQRHCQCNCHNPARGDYNDAAQRQDYPAIVIFSRVETVNVRVPVEANDALEAAVASGCDCINNHCPALLTRYVPDPDAWIDPPRNTDTVGDEPDGN